MKQVKWILLPMSVLTSIGTWAQSITEQEAAERALQFLSHRNPSSRPIWCVSIQRKVFIR